VVCKFLNRNRNISTSQLYTLLCLHLKPINLIISQGSKRFLILKLASLLDAFRGYPFPT